MQTVTAHIEALADKLSADLHELLLKHTQLYEAFGPNSGVFSLLGNYAFKVLSEEGRRVQSRALARHNHLFNLLGTLLAAQPSDTQRAFEEAKKRITQTIELEHTWSTTTEEEYALAQKQLTDAVNLLLRLHDDSQGEPVVVSDTNALISNPKIEQWSFAEFQKFTLVLLPTVLSELDEHKVNHRNPEVRSKSEMLSRQCKEYRRRGSLLDGVNIVTGKITLRAVALEPDKDKTLPWFDLKSNDDRILAGTIEIMRLHPRSPVYLVTRDLNMQTKAEFAAIPFLEPPEILKP